MATPSAIARRCAPPPRKTTAIYDAALTPTGVNLAQFSLLRKIRARPRRLSLSELGPSRRTRSLDGRPQRQGFAAHGPDRASTPGDDHREATVTLAKTGRAALREGAPLWDAGAAQDRSDAWRRRRASICGRCSTLCEFFDPIRVYATLSARGPDAPLDAMRKARDMISNSPGRLSRDAARPLRMGGASARSPSSSCSRRRARWARPASSSLRSGEFGWSNADISFALAVPPRCSSA